MYILIIDDEKIAALALKKLVEDYCKAKQVDLNCKTFERACDAIKEIETAQSLPDILFTDIRMPIMDGLDLTNKLKTEYPSILIVIISGYSDFNYAQTALKYNASDYLLKPISRQQIYDCMDALCMKLQDSLISRQENICLKSQALFSQMIFNDKFGLKDLTESLSIDSNVYFISLIFLHSSMALGNTERQALLSASNQNVIRIPIESPTHKDIFILNLYSLKSLDTIKIIQQKYCTIIYSELSRYIDCNNFSITSSEISTTDCPLQTLYLQCYYSSKEYLLTSDNPFSHTGEQEEKEYISPYSAKTEYEILKSFDFKNPLLTKQLFKNALLNLTSKENISLWSLSDLISFLVIILNKKIKEYNERHDNSCDYISETKITNFETLESIEKFFDQQIDRIYILLQDSENRQTENPVKIMEKYIQENFFLDITLQDIASNILYMHPSYLSRLFKSRLGISFSKYLLQYRLKVSKKMLLEYRTTSVSEIASLCGFSDCSYFVKQFKSIYGTTPNSYRTKH